MEVSGEELKQAIQKNTAVVVHCSAEWSEPCKQMAAVMKELESIHSSVKFLTVDIEKSPSIQKEHSIQAVPHFLFFNKGCVVDRVEGADPAELVDKLDVFMSANPPKEEQTLTECIEQLLATADVMLFMKGSPEAPQCGFSSKVVDALNAAHIDFSHFDILQDNEIRQGLKDYSVWPTYPQLYVRSEFIGGCDIVMELQEKRQLQQEIVNKTGERVLKETPDQRCERLVKMAPVMLFMKGSPSAPRCKFSSRVVGALNASGIQFSHFDILEDDAVRQALKNYAQWPTYPQLYVNGTFIGGCDIIEELHSKGELHKHITSLLSGTNDV